MGIKGISQVLVWTFVGWLCIASTCASQAAEPSQAQAAKLATFLAVHLHKIGRAQKNLLETSTGIVGSPEDYPAEMINSAATDARDYGMALQVVANIYPVMTNAHDREITQHYLVALSSDLSSMSDVDIREINLSLSQLQSPAIVSEAQRIRDLIQEMRDRVKAFALPRVQ